MKSKALIMKEMRERRIAAGLVEFKVWVKPSMKAKLKRYIKKNEGKDNAGNRVDKIRRV